MHLLNNSHHMANKWHKLLYFVKIDEITKKVRIPDIDFRRFYLALADIFEPGGSWNTRYAPLTMSRFIRRAAFSPAPRERTNSDAFRPIIFVEII